MQRGPFPDKFWRVHRRYNDFVQLNGALSTSNFPLSFPPKRLIGNMEPDFIAQRQVALQVHIAPFLKKYPTNSHILSFHVSTTYLQNYLNVVLMNPILASSLSMKKFLDPENYTAPLHGNPANHTNPWNCVFKAIVPFQK